MIPFSPDPDKLRAFREQTLYRLLLRARRAENVEMVARILQADGRGATAADVRILLNASG